MIAIKALATGILLYLWAIMPRIFNKPSKKMFKEYYYAHRGLHDNNSDAPENSMKAFKKAVDAGYGIELDVQLTKDKIPVIFHDDNLLRVCGEKGAIGDYTWKELKQFRLFDTEETIPKFEEVLQLVDGQVPLIIEIKCNYLSLEICRLTYEKIKSYNGIYCVESFHPLAIRWFKKHAPNIMRGQLSSDFTKEGDKRVVLKLLSHLLFNCIGKPDFIAYNCQYSGKVSRYLCKRIYRACMVAWTVRSKEQLKKIQREYDMFIFEGFLP